MTFISCLKTRCFPAMLTDNSDTRRYKFTRGTKRLSNSSRSFSSREQLDVNQQFSGLRDWRNVPAQERFDDLRRGVDRDAFRRDDFSGRRDFDPPSRNPFR